MADSSCIRLMVVVLCFSYFICLNVAIPATRTSNMVQKSQSYEVAKGVLLENLDQKVEINTIRRKDIELNDYPGSGANNRHTPRPHEPGRGCIDC